MDITLDKSSNTEASINIKLTEADYSEKVEKKIKQYAKQADIKGFRKGKVPAGVIRRMYGTSILVDEVNHILSHAVEDYIRDNKLQIIGQPLPNVEENANIDWDKQKEFEFSYSVGLVGDITYTTDLTIDSYSISVDEKQLNETIENLLQNGGEQTSPEVAEETDKVTGELTIEGEEEAIHVMVDIADLATKTGKEIFIGAKAEDEITFDIRKAYRSNEKVANFLHREEADVKEIKGDVKMVVKSISRIAEAEMNQEFFDKILGPGKASNEDEFRAEVSKILGENYDNQVENYTARQIQDKLVDGTEVELPEAFLKRWLVATQEELTAEKVEAEFDNYRKEFKWMLLADKIAADNEIKVEDADIKTKATEMFKVQFGAMTGGEQNEQIEEMLKGIVDNYLKENNGQNYMNLYNQVRFDRIIKLVEEKATVVEKDVTFEEFTKAVSAE
ncbi:trigger factor [Persicobacter sp. CCB-QB2]|uniref:trigger factor n=1 Tax=Persicobacter sp. CCB-QB2 TaxID=1561025 RepID=UPI0006A9D542|nr:trigger factor [Persicobacter sp. CCB-QB2]